MSIIPNSVLTEEQENSPKTRKRLFEAGEMKLLVLAPDGRAELKKLLGWFDAQGTAVELAVISISHVRPQPLSDVSVHGYGSRNCSARLASMIWL